MDSLATVIKELRSKVGDSQQAFANRLGLSVRAIANYEAGRIPKTEVLWRFIGIASDHGLHQLGQELSRAFSERMKGNEQPANSEESAFVRGMLALARNRHLLPTWPAIGRQMLVALKNLLAAAKRHEAVRTDTEELEELVEAMRQVVEPTAMESLRRLAVERRRQTGEEFDAALAAVLNEQPGLARELFEERQTRESAHRKARKK